MTSNDYTDGKLVTADQAISGIRPGDKIFLGTACATPLKLIAALEKEKERKTINLADVQLFHFLTDDAIPHKDGEPITRFLHKVFYVGSNSKEAVKTGQADYIPLSISSVSNLIKNGSISFDACFIQTSMPNEHGFVSLGTSVDITKEVAENAGTVIAEINPNMPFTLGDSFLPISRIEKMVLVDSPVIEYEHKPADEVAEKIARYVARIIDDGSTLQIGLGQIPNEMLKYLTGRRNLGIHSDVITDPVIDLIKNGVITGNEKTIHRGQVVTSYAMGTKRLYDFIDNNPLFSFHPMDYVCDPAVLAKNKKLVSISQCFAMDLTGQVCSDQYGGEFYGGVSTQPDFLRGAANSAGGKPIICLRSTTEDGEKSRIRPLLMEGEGVTIPRADVHYVITEYGMAYLFGKSIRERALSLIEIAHPSFRPWLLKEGKRLGYIRQDQTLRNVDAYLAEEEREEILKNGQKILIRPAKASDVEGLQDIFYHMSETDILTRFFNSLSSLSVDMAEHLCNVNFEDEVAFMAVIGDREKDHVIGTSCYFLDPSTNLGEVAYMIRPEYQGQGLGSLLQKRMAEYAKSKGLRGFKADILEGNESMVKLAQKNFNTTMKLEFGAYQVTMLFIQEEKEEESYE